MCAFKKIAPSGGRHENVWGIVFRVKNHDFTPKNDSFYNYGGRREKCWGISCEKSRFYAKKNIFFSNFRGGARRVRPPPWIRPWGRMPHFLGTCNSICPFKLQSNLK